MAGNLPILPGEIPSMSDWADHLSTLFPEVRLKKFLEMRGADGGPWKNLCGLPAFWVGLLYHGESLDAAWDLVKDWSQEEHERLRREVPKLGLKTPLGQATLLEFAREVFKVVERGLAARSVTDSEGNDERQFLASFRETLERGRTPAEELLEAYHGRWNGVVGRGVPGKRLLGRGCLKG